MIQDHQTDHNLSGGTHEYEKKFMTIHPTVSEISPSLKSTLTPAGNPVFSDPQWFLFSPCWVWLQVQKEHTQPGDATTVTYMTPNST